MSRDIRHIADFRSLDSYRVIEALAGDPYGVVIPALEDKLSVARNLKNQLIAMDAQARILAAIDGAPKGIVYISAVAEQLDGLISLLVSDCAMLRSLKTSPERVYDRVDEMLAGIQSMALSLDVNQSPNDLLAEYVSDLRDGLNLKVRLQ
ncbi:hypothetical protein [Frigidibacter sp. MR17.24]|uniref:hypothetical protein n=1 Tax=Frigidibacter sp. MR17.24 TaxID=3127345 RepID=UPI003012D7D5